MGVNRGCGVEGQSGVAWTGWSGVGMTVKSDASKCVQCLSVAINNFFTPITGLMMKCPSPIMYLRSVRRQVDADFLRFPP